MDTAIDIGTTFIKVSSRSSDGSIRTSRFVPTPTTPDGILAEVRRLLGLFQVDRFSMSCFRRALVVGDRIVLARERQGVAPGAPGSTGTDLLNPLAPVHRWMAIADGLPGDFVTLDGWLAERLTGVHAVSESQAWLSGLWQTGSQRWSTEAVEWAGLRRDRLPTVLTEPQLVGKLCLPILGDHEATALAAYSASPSELRLVECGTAVAVMHGVVARPSGLGIRSATWCGYAETVDPWFAYVEPRGGGDLVPRTEESRSAVIHGMLAALGLDGEQFTCCGGGATERLVSALRVLGIDAHRSPDVCSGYGALMMLEQEIDGDG